MREFVPPGGVDILWQKPAWKSRDRSFFVAHLYREDGDLHGSLFRVIEDDGDGPVLSGSQLKFVKHQRRSQMGYAQLFRDRQGNDFLANLEREPDDVMDESDLELALRQLADPPWVGSRLAEGALGRIASRRGLWVGSRLAEGGSGMFVDAAQIQRDVISEAQRLFGEDGRKQVGLRHWPDGTIRLVFLNYHRPPSFGKGADAEEALADAKARDGMTYRRRIVFQPGTRGASSAALRVRDALSGQFTVAQVENLVLQTDAPFQDVDSAIKYARASKNVVEVVEI